MSLFKHEVHPHQPTNINDLHQRELETAGLNQRIAVTLTRWVGSMECAYIFTGIAVIGLFGLLNLLPSILYLLMQWLSQQFLQLVLLSVIMVGQAVLSRHQELQGEEQFNFTEKSYHNIEQVMQHLDAQDQKIIEILEKQNEILLQLAKGKE